MADYSSFNYDHPTPDLTKPFSIVCPKNTDIYDTPPDTHRFNAPIIFTKTTVGQFKSIAVTISADWQQRYDQGGLIVVIHNQDGTKKWIKTGIEFLEGVPWISVVTKDRWADWSLRPLSEAGSTSGRIQVESEGKNLWVYVIDKDGKKLPTREVTWWGEFEASTEIDVGIAAAKPSTEGGDLLVNFTDYELNA